MPEWPLYPPIQAHFQAKGFRTASQVTDPRGTRFELDVVAFTPELDDVRIVEAKRTASDALLAQCEDRWRFTPRVYAAVPPAEVDTLETLAAEGDASMLGILAVRRRGAEEVRAPTPVAERVETGKARALERVLRSEIAEGRS